MNCQEIGKTSGICIDYGVIDGNMYCIVVDPSFCTYIYKVGIEKNTHKESSTSSPCEENIKGFKPLIFPLHSLLYQIEENVVFSTNNQT